MENGNHEHNTNWTLPTPPEKKPIVCPICGSVHLAFVTEYHKALALRILRLVIALIAAAVFAYNCYSIFVELKKPEFGSTFIPLFFLILIAVVISWFIIAIESKTHVKAICKDCGNLWLLD